MLNRSNFQFIISKNSQTSGQTQIKQRRTTAYPIFYSEFQFENALAKKIYSSLTFNGYRKKKERNNFVLNSEISS